MRIEHLERDVAVVTDSSQVLDDRPELEVSLAGEDPVAVAGQLARGAAHVTQLNPRQIARREIGEVFELARSGVVMEHIKADAGVGRSRLGDQGECRLEARADGGRLLKLERDPHAERRGQLGGFAERRRRPGRIPRGPADAQNRE